jgi:hypothetical protein
MFTYMEIFAVTIATYGNVSSALTISPPQKRTRSSLSVSEVREFDRLRKRQKQASPGEATITVDEYIRIFRNDAMSKDQLAYYKQCLGKVNKAPSVRLAEKSPASAFFSTNQIPFVQDQTKNISWCVLGEYDYIISVRHTPH